MRRVRIGERGRERLLRLLGLLGLYERVEGGGGGNVVLDEDMYIYQ